MSVVKVLVGYRRRTASVVPFFVVVVFGLAIGVCRPAVAQSGRWAI